MRRLPEIAPSEMDLPVVEIVEETPTTKTLVFDLEGRPFRFYPGQFVVLEVPHPETGEKLRRAYSIASPPTRRDRIELTVKRIENGRASVYLTTRVRIGERFRMKGPYGKFYWTEELHDRIALLGAGSGVVPLVSILRYIRDRDLRDVDVVFLGSFTSYEEIIYREELLELGKLKNVKIALTLTREFPDSWQGYRGRINREILSREIPDAGKRLHYLCGPPGFVESVRGTLLDLGVDRRNVKTERYR